MRKFAIVEIFKGQRNICSSAELTEEEIEELLEGYDNCYNSKNKIAIKLKKVLEK